MKTTLLCLSSMIWISPVWSQTLCVFDPMGTSGELYTLMKDFALFAKSQQANVDLLPFKKEEDAITAFKNMECMGAIMTDVSARQFNSFTGSLNALGAIPNNQVARAALNLLDHPKLAANLMDQTYEIAGVIPVGLVRMIVKDRSIDDLHDAKGRTFAVMNSDLAQMDVVRKIGGKPVSASVDDFISLLSSSKVDVIGLPALVFEPLGVYKAIGSKGGIVNYPVTFLSMNLVIRHEDFNQKFGISSRTWFKMQSEKMFKKIELAEKNVPESVWIPIKERNAEGYDRIIRELRARMIKEGIYNKKALMLLKKIRCQQDPMRFECALTDE
jgi:hypothetical protein